MNAVARPRHDPADLRRLAEFGYQPLQWRRPPAAPPRRSVLVLSEPAPAKGLLADLLRALSLAGYPLQLVAPTSTAPIDAKNIIVRFASTSASIDAVPATGAVQSAIVLPEISDLRGNPAAKRAAWAALRAALR